MKRLPVVVHNAHVEAGCRDLDSLWRKFSYVPWCNGCSGRKPGMREFPLSDQSYQRAVSRLGPPENLVSSVPRSVRGGLN